MKNHKTREKTLKKRKFLRKMILTVSLLVIFVTIFGIACKVGLVNIGDIVNANGEEFHIEFDEKKSLYGKSDIEEDFTKNTTKFKDVKGEDRLAINNKALRIEMPEGGNGIEGAGARIYMSVSEGAEYTMEYQVLFDGNGEEYNWANGGRLCGLASEDFEVGLEWSDEGEIKPLVSQNGGNEKIYEPIGKFTTNSWQTIKICTKVNNVGKEDGEIEIWINGTQTFNEKGISLCEKGTKINMATLAAYPSGVNEKQQSVYVDNYTVCPKIQKEENLEDFECVEKKDEYTPRIDVRTSESQIENNGNIVTQVFIVNDSDEEFKDWCIKIPRSKVEIKDIWGAKLGKDEENYVITAEAWNEVIEAKSNDTSFSFMTTSEYPDTSLLEPKFGMK